MKRFFGYSLTYSWDDEEEEFEFKMANSVKYGLTAYIVTNDMDKAKNS